MGKLKPAHYEAIVARSDFEDLQTGNKHGKILYAATCAYVSSGMTNFAERLYAALEVDALKEPLEEIISTARDVEPTGTPEEFWMPPYYGCSPIYCNWFTQTGGFVGTSFHGYQFCLPEASEVIASVPRPQSLLEDRRCSTVSSGKISWTIASREMKRIFQGGPPTMHLGVAFFQDRQYSLDLFCAFEGANNNEDTIYYQAAVKRIGRFSGSNTMMIAFEGKDPVHHDFVHHVYVSPLLSMSRTDLLNVKGNFALNVNMSTF